MDQSKISETIKKALPDATVYVESPDGHHFQGLVISPAFEDMMLVKQHQLVMKALKENFDGGNLHALELKTFTPSAWDEVKHQYQPM